MTISALQQTDVMETNYALVESLSSAAIMQLDGVADARRRAKGQG